MDIKTRKTRQITYGSAISTSPSYSPDGSKIVFNSDRGGNQQLYVMNADGSDVERISFGKGRYATPVWSPRGDYIAFTKMVNGAFYIGVMYPDGTGERILADGYLVEGPTWSPNGRVLMYFRQDRGSPVRLYSIDLTGYNQTEYKKMSLMRHFFLAFTAQLLLFIGCRYKEIIKLFSVNLSVFKP